MAREWIEIELDLDEGFITLNCLCDVSRECCYPTDGDGGGWEVSVEIREARIGKLRVTRDMLVEMYGEDGIRRHEEGAAETIAENASDGWLQPEPESVDLYLEGRA